MTTPHTKNEIMDVRERKTKKTDSIYKKTKKHSECSNLCQGSSLSEQYLLLREQSCIYYIFLFFVLFKCTIRSLQCNKKKYYTLSTFVILFYYFLAILWLYYMYSINLLLNKFVTKLQSLFTLQSSITLQLFKLSCLQTE